MATEINHQLALASGNVTFRRFKAEDAALFPQFQEQIAHESTHTLQIPGRTFDPEKLISNWQRSPSKDLFLGAFHNNNIIGSASLHSTLPHHPWVKHSAKFGMMVLKNFWGQGVGRKLLEILHDFSDQCGYSRIEAYVRTKNIRAVKMYLKSGYEIEGTRKNAAYINGHFVDEFHIARILESDKSPFNPKKLQFGNFEILPLFDLAPDTVAKFYQKNKAFLKPTSPSPAPGFFTSEFWENRISTSLAEWTQGSAHRWGIIEKSNPQAMIGAMNYTQIFRGAFNACYLGFCLDQDFQSQGIMKKALILSLNHIFKEIGLHRVMANHLEDNHKSEKLLNSLGFKKEGLAKNYLQIDGQFRDHCMRSLNRKQWMSKITN